MRRMNGTTLRFEGAGGGRGARASRLVLVALALGLSLGGSSCSLIVDREADQCETTADCAAFPGTTCADGVCTGTIAECLTNQQCVDNKGPFHICRKSDRTCVPLLSPLCATVEGDYIDDNAFYFGSVAPLVGDEATGKSIENAIKLAIGQFEQAANGLPPRPGATGRRPMVLISCNDSTESVTGIEAAKHLVETVQVPAIIGAAYSGITIDMVTEVTIPNNVLTISPSATSVLITSLEDNNLVWRTAPSDIFQSSALALYLPTVEAQVRDELMLMAADKIKVSIIHKGDAYGNGLANALVEKTTFNGANPTDPANDGFYERFNYGDPDNQVENPTKYVDAANVAIMQESHIIALLGTGEAVADVLVKIEAGWNAALPYRPRYLFGDGTVLDALWETVGLDDDLRQRITGSVPGTNNVVFSNFRGEYGSQFPDDVGSPDIFGAAGAYDATYLLAYSSAAAISDTGPNLAEALKRLIGPGEVIQARSDQISGAFQKLASGATIDFDGASGPLKFDPLTGEAPSDIQIWCMPKDTDNTAGSAISSGLFYDAVNLIMDGAFDTTKCEFTP